LEVTVFLDIQMLVTVQYVFYYSLINKIVK